ncbi:NADPH-dependent FMN reductase [Deinococcus sp.]|uniref:NADPH-dependent FMN reductase n=1 Tax=Deinococcus sp. TaxID=47478 RepID=UPI003CC6C62D
MIRLLGISGSLRTASIDSALLHAASSLTPGGAELSVYGEWGSLPPFSPDLEAAAPPSVLAFRAALADVRGLLIACPEYAHGIPGAFKNALDWVVGSGELSGKPVLTLNASPASYHAQMALLEVLRTMDARPVSGSPVAIPGLHRRMTAAEVLGQAEARAVLVAAVAELSRAAH